MLPMQAYSSVIPLTLETRRVLVIMLSIIIPIYLISLGAAFWFFIQSVLSKKGHAVSVILFTQVDRPNLLKGVDNK